MATGGTGQQGEGRTITLRESDVKICDLCGWLNLETNRECFMCGWHGHFEHDAGAVHNAVGEAIKQYGGLELRHLTNESTYRQSASASGSPAGFRGWLNQLVRRLRR